MTKIKICGLSRKCDIEYANLLNIDYIGFVFVKESKRYIYPDDAIKLRKKLREGIIPVGVFSDASIDYIVGLLRYKIIEAVQLHGNESEEYIDNLRKKVNCTIIKAFSINSSTDIETAKKSTADYILLDSGGGTGKEFNWDLIKNITRPYFLAGGISSDNVNNAINKLHPFAVDASTSLETDGYKDFSKMTAFVNTVNNNTFTERTD